MREHNKRNNISIDSEDFVFRLPKDFDLDEITKEEENRKDMFTRGDKNFVNGGPSNAKSQNSYTDSEDKKLGYVGRMLWLLTLVIFLVFAFLTGHYTLTEEQEAVVFTFGKPHVVSKAGWNWKVPLVQTIEKVPKSIMGLAIGYDVETNESIENESLMITKDFNFVMVDFYIEYRVSDPIKAVIHKDTYKSIIKMLAQSYIRDTIGVHLVDEVMTTGKPEIQAEIESALKERIAAEDIGYSIERVLIQDGELPTQEVQEAFKAVENAKQSMETRINNANKYRSENIPKMEAEVDAIIKKAEAYKQDRINEATGQVARFEAMYREYEKYPFVTKKRMFYETMEEIMPGLKVIINGSNGTQTMLPLDSFSTTIVNQEKAAE